jgi:alpha-tubulin suppressor-like RCC1 family protein
LGPSQHTQYALMPLPETKHTIESVALGQDHTLALTSTGEVLSWGLNRFSQLGYVIEVSSGNKHDESIQASPRKVGSLKKEVVKGVAACKTASACWTGTEVWTWGTNGGQLGRYHLSG